MGRRQDDYNLDRAHGTTTSPTTSTPTPTAFKPKSSTRPASPARRDGQQQRAASGRRPRERGSRNRRPKQSACQNPQVRKGVGACIFVLGIPCLIAGLIFTIVSSTDDGDDESGRKYPASFPVAGPILLVVSVLCFGIGVLLHNIAILVAIRDCLNLSDKDSFCRRRFPKLSEWLRPDNTAALNRTALNNLQTAPARSALRKARNPDLVVAIENENLGQGHGEGHHQGSTHHHPPKRKRGVTFSHSDDEGHVHRLDSSASETERASLQSDSGVINANGYSPSSSLLSLRHCRIHPKDEVFWTDSSGAGAVGGGGQAPHTPHHQHQNGGGGDGEWEAGAGHPVSSTHENSVGPSGEKWEGEGGHRKQAFLSDIDEENTSDVRGIEST